MLEFRTQGFNGYAVKYSPFFDNRIAVATAANFGLVGNGRLYILELTANGIQPLKHFSTQDSLFDLSWSEGHELQCVTASGDGSLKLYDISLNEFPIAQWKEHKREVFSTSWNMVTKDRFASSSWDGTIKIWQPQVPQSLLTLPTHTCTYSTLFSPHSPTLLSAVSSDSHLRIFDLRTPASASNHLTQMIPIHAPKTINQPTPGVPRPQSFQPSEALTHDWNKYRDTVIAVAGVDRLVRTFDIRAPHSGPLTILSGHDYAIRKLAWSPHLPDLLLTASYDMTCRIWRDGYANEGDVDVFRNGQGVGLMGMEIGKMNVHTEFVTGVDWCLFGAEGWAASCAWDERVCVWDVRNFMR